MKWVKNKLRKLRDKRSLGKKGIERGNKKGFSTKNGKMLVF